MTRPQHVTVNVHCPRVTDIARYDTGMMAISLGNGELHGTVTLFADDDMWASVVAAVNKFQLTDASGGRICPECNFIGNDEAQTTEHVFANHPDAVAQ